MSKADIRKFYGKAVKDPTLVVQLWKGTSGKDGFIRKAVKEAKSLGYEFTADEGKEWWSENQQLIKDHSELLDNQIEKVRSGKTTD